MGFTSRKIDFKMWGSGVRHLLARLNETRPVASCLQNLPRKWRIPEKRHKIFDAFAVFTSVRDFKSITIKKV